MGCGGSSGFTEDSSKFFKKQFQRDGQYLHPKIVKESGFTKVQLLKDLYMSSDHYTVKDEGGEEVVKIMNGSGRKKVLAPDGSLICVLIFSVRYSEVNAVDAAFNLPHLYIYSTNPYKEGQEETEYEEGGAKLYLWARVHKVANVGKPKFEIAMAEFTGSPKGPNIEKFGFTGYTATKYSDTQLEIFKGGPGCCRVEGAPVEDTYLVTVAPWIDPVLMFSGVMAMDFLKGR